MFLSQCRLNNKKKYLSVMFSIDHLCSALTTHTPHSFNLLFKINMKTLCLQNISSSLHGAVFEPIMYKRSPKLDIASHIASCKGWDILAAQMIAGVGYGKCGVSVIRVSGPCTRKALRSIVGFENFDLNPRHAYLKALHHPMSKEIIDRGLVLWFPGPASFTGEDCCEFQVHGSLAVIAALLDALGNIQGLRPAKPGEFTMRAFFGGKLDLTEVDGLADLIHAETEAQRKQALLQTTGSLSRLYHGWRKRLIRCAAHLEAYIDFAEDENIESDVVLQLTKELKRIIVEMTAHLNDQRRGEMLRDGIQTAIIGAPNVGKSSLLNLLCQKEVSIVSPRAGTTRDIIQSTHNFGGYPVVFADTAGLRKQTEDPIEIEGISRAKNCLQNADLILLIADAQKMIKENITADTIEQYKNDYLRELGIDTDLIANKYIKLIANKIDLLSNSELKMFQNLETVGQLSCREEMDDVLQTFLKSFESWLKEICGQPSAENPRITHARYRQQLERCIEHIKIFLEEYSPDSFPDMAIASQKLRKSIRCIEQITGHVSSDDILDVVFKDFCIGK